jgi:hypothetical protein
MIRSGLKILSDRSSWVVIIWQRYVKVLLLFSEQGS